MLVDFFQSTLWRLKEEDFPWFIRPFVRFLKIMVLSLRGFYEDDCFIQGAALTYYTLFAIVPALAIAFGIAKGFYLDSALESYLLQTLKSQEYVAAESIKFAKGLLERAQGGLIAITGLIILVWAVVQMLMVIEDIFNQIWRVREGRDWKRKCIDYLAICIIGPVLLVLSQITTIILVQETKALTELFQFLGPINVVVTEVVKLLPYVSVWLLFTFIYRFIPYTNITIKASFLAAVVAGTLSLVFQWIYLKFQIGISHYSAVYGSLAALPLFLVWLRINWFIILYGAELAFSIQNVSDFDCEDSALDISHTQKNIYSLQIMHHVVHNFLKGNKRESAAELAKTLYIPVRLVKRLLNVLVEKGLVIEPPSKGNIGYHPGRDINTLTVWETLRTLEHTNGDFDLKNKSAVTKELISILQSFESGIQQDPKNVLIKDIPST